MLSKKPVHTDMMRFAIRSSYLAVLACRLTHLQDKVYTHARARARTHTHTPLSLGLEIKPVSDNTHTHTHCHTQTHTCRTGIHKMYDLTCFLHPSNQPSSPSNETSST